MSVSSRKLHLLPTYFEPRYGPAPKNSDTAINVLLDVVQDQSGKTYKMDHYATRYPTNVEDISASDKYGFCAQHSVFNTYLTLGLKKDTPPILHYSAEEPYTKYEICLVFAKILSLSHNQTLSHREEKR